MKSELSPRSHRLLMMDGDAIAIATTKCVKRRRRDSSMAVLGGNEQQGEQSEAQQPLMNGQSTATTVKRSSRFRGVSRRVIFINILLRAHLL